MTLPNQYRPQTWDDIMGNEEIVMSLKSVFSRKDDKPHSFLFTGPSGCGKTTFAMIIKNVLNCSDIDFNYYNAANTRGIDTVRTISEMTLYPAMSGANKIYVLDECHQITGAAQEALLLLLEQPPSHVYFILCTTEPERLKPTIHRRCHEYKVSLLRRHDMTELLNKVIKKEGVENYPETILEHIHKMSGGSPGQALSMLDEVIDMTDDEQALKQIKNTYGSRFALIELCRILISNNSQETKWKEAQQQLKNFDGEAESARYGILGYLSKVMLGNRGNTSIALIMSCFTDSLMYSGKAGLILGCHLACQVK